MGRNYNGFSSAYRYEVGARQEALFRADPSLRVTVCRACGVDRGIVQHLEDYDSPLDIIGLCHRCHTMVHERFDFPAAWAKYAAAIAHGLRFRIPSPAGHWMEVRSGMCSSSGAYRTARKRGPTVKRTVLDDIADGVFLPPGRVSGSVRE